MAVFSIEGKTPEEKEILNISDSCLETLFLSNFNILVGVLFGPTDWLESNEDMIFSILVSGTYKKGNIRSIFKKSEKCLCENEILSFVLPAIEGN